MTDELCSTHGHSLVFQSVDTYHFRLLLSYMHHLYDTFTPSFVKVEPWGQDLVREKSVFSTMVGDVY